MVNFIELKSPRFEATPPKCMLESTKEGVEGRSLEHGFCLIQLPHVLFTCKKTPNIIIMNVSTNMAVGGTYDCL